MPDLTTLKANSLRRSPVRAWFLGAGILVLVRFTGELIPLTDATGWLWITRMGEAWMVAGLLVLGLGHLPWRSIIEEIGKWRIGGLMTLVGLMFIGQLVEIGTDPYPFVQWSMYTGRVTEVTYGRIEVLLPHGELEELPLRGQTRISTEPRAVTGRLLELAELAEDGDQVAASLLNETLLFLAPPAAESARVLRCTVAQPTSDRPAACETVASVALRRDGS